MPCSPDDVVDLCVQSLRALPQRKSWPRHILAWPCLQPGREGHCCSRTEPTGSRSAGHCSIKAITQNKYIYLSLSLPFQFIDQITNTHEKRYEQTLSPPPSTHPSPSPCCPWSFSGRGVALSPGRCAHPLCLPSHLQVWPLSASSTVQSAFENRSSFFYLLQF